MPTQPATDSESGAGTDLRRAWTDTAPVCPSMITLGVTFGVLVVHTGLSWWWTPAFGGLIFAGSLEFLLLGLISSGAPLAAVAATTFLVNSRHVFYAFSFPLDRVRGRLGKTYSMFAMIDEAYAILATRPSATLTSRRILLTQALMHSYWVVGGLLGAFFGNFVPPTVKGIGFALTALFAVLAFDTCAQAKEMTAPTFAVCCGAVAFLVAPGAFLVTSMGLYVATLVAAHIIAQRRQGRP